MKVFGGVLVVVMALSMGGCGKTLAQIKDSGDGMIDVGAAVAKKGVDAGISVYNILKTMIDDAKDNVATVTNALK